MYLHELHYLGLCLRYRQISLMIVPSLPRSGDSIL